MKKEQDDSWKPHLVHVVVYNLYSVRIVTVDVEREKGP